MATANLGITVTTAGVTEAVTDLDKIAPAAARAEQATTKLAQTTKTTLGQAANDAESFAQRMERALNLNIKGPGVDAGRAADIAAYGQELDRLRQKFNQAHQIMISYRTAAGEIRQANAVGAISINEMNVALERLRQTTQRQIETERQLRQGRQQSGGMAAPGGPGGRGGRGGVDRMMQTNIMYQLQDIAVTTAMGMSPAMIALQQGTQVGAAISGAGGLKAGLTGIVGA